MPMPASCPDKTQYWKMGRDVIKHEDGLIHQRLSSLLTVQGLLLSAYLVLQAAALSGKIGDVLSLLVQGFLVIVFLFAIWFCLLIGKAVDCASKHMSTTRQWWHKKYGEAHAISTAQEAAVNADFPQILGHFPKIRWGLRYANLPYVLAILNLVVVFASLTIGIMSFCQERQSNDKESVGQPKCNVRKTAIPLGTGVKQDSVMPIAAPERGRHSSEHLPKANAVRVIQTRPLQPTCYPYVFSTVNEGGRC